MFINNFNTSDTHEKSEIWKPIEGYENLYEVSNLGRVRSIDAYIKCKNNSMRLRRGVILSAFVDKHGYQNVNTSKNGVTKYQRVHRLVAKAFIPNPENLPVINHKNEVKTDNRVENLEWCTVEYNTNYGTSLERRMKSQSNPIEAIDSKGNVVLRFESGNEAKRNGYCNAMLCCRGLYKTCGGYRWRFA